MTAIYRHHQSGENHQSSKSNDLLQTRSEEKMENKNSSLYLTLIYLFSRSCYGEHPQGAFVWLLLVKTELKKTKSYFQSLSNPHPLVVRHHQFHNCYDLPHQVSDEVHFTENPKKKHLHSTHYCLSEKRCSHPFSSQATSLLICLILFPFVKIDSVKAMTWIRSACVGSHILQTIQWIYSAVKHMQPSVQLFTISDWCGIMNMHTMHVGP